MPRGPFLNCPSRASTSSGPRSFAPRTGSDRRPRLTVLYAILMPVAPLLKGALPAVHHDHRAGRPGHAERRPSRGIEGHPRERGHRRGRRPARRVMRDAVGAPRRADAFTGARTALPFEVSPRSVACTPRHRFSTIRRSRWRSVPADCAAWSKTSPISRPTSTSRARSATCSIAGDIAAGRRRRPRGRSAAEHRPHHARLRPGHRRLRAARSRTRARSRRRR